MSYVHPTSEDRCCNICGKLAATHARCGQCGIFIGPDHAITALVDGQHCFTCRRMLDRWEAAEARIAQGREMRHAAMSPQGGRRYG